MRREIRYTLYGSTRGRDVRGEIIYGYQHGTKESMVGRDNFRLELEKFCDAEIMTFIEDVPSETSATAPDPGLIAHLIQTCRAARHDDLTDAERAIEPLCYLCQRVRAALRPAPIEQRLETPPLAERMGIDRIHGGGHGRA